MSVSLGHHWSQEARCLCLCLGEEWKYFCHEKQCAHGGRHDWITRYVTGFLGRRRGWPRLALAAGLRPGCPETPLSSRASCGRPPWDRVLCAAAPRVSPLRAPRQVRGGLHCVVQQASVSLIRVVISCRKLHKQTLSGKKTQNQSNQPASDRRGLVPRPCSGRLSHLAAPSSQSRDHTLARGKAVLPSHVWSHQNRLEMRD